MSVFSKRTNQYVGMENVIESLRALTLNQRIDFINSYLSTVYTKVLGTLTHVRMLKVADHFSHYIQLG